MLNLSSYHRVLCALTRSIDPCKAVELILANGTERHRELLKSKNGRLHNGGYYALESDFGVTDIEVDDRNMLDILAKHRNFPARISAELGNSHFTASIARSLVIDLKLLGWLAWHSDVRVFAGTSTPIRRGSKRVYATQGAEAFTQDEFRTLNEDAEALLNAENERGATPEGVLELAKFIASPEVGTVINVAPFATLAKACGIVGDTSYRRKTLIGWAGFNLATVVKKSDFGVSRQQLAKALDKKRGPFVSFKKMDGERVFSRHGLSRAFDMKCAAKLMRAEAEMAKSGCPLSTALLDQSHYWNDYTIFKVTRDLLEFAEDKKARSEDKVRARALAATIAEALTPPGGGDLGKWFQSTKETRKELQKAISEFRNELKSPIGIRWPPVDSSLEEEHSRCIADSLVAVLRVTGNRQVFFNDDVTWKIESDGRTTEMKDGPTTDGPDSEIEFTCDDGSGIDSFDNFISFMEETARMEPPPPPTTDFNNYCYYAGTLFLVASSFWFLLASC
jgi:hypothetical protein